MLQIPNYRHTRDTRSFRDLWVEVSKQVTGSDIESGYSYIYTWLTNQFGHFMIGFAGTILVGWLAIEGFGLFFRRVNYLWHWPWAGIAVAVVWFVLWVLKEWLVDVATALRDLHFTDEQRLALLHNKTIGTERRSYIIPKMSDLKNVSTVLFAHVTRRKCITMADWFKYDVVRDSQMDSRFYLAGGFTAVAMYLAPTVAAHYGHTSFTGWIPFLTFVATLIWLFARSRDWLWANIAFDRAQLPFVSRFVLNARPPGDGARQNSMAFATRRNDNSEDGRPGHLIIIGPPKSGRTTIAVALGVEALLQTLPPRDVVVYTTFCKLLDRVAEAQMAPATSSASGPPGTRPVWPPDVAELLIVDDVGAQGANGPLLSPVQFQAELKANQPLRKICDSKHVIWVIGDNPNNSQHWIAAIKGAFAHPGFTPRVVPPIELSAPIPQRERLRSAQQWARMSAYGT